MTPVRHWREVRWGPALKPKMAGLAEWLDARAGVLVAYSGGVDSTFLAVMAFQVLGGRMLAVTADSPSLPRSDLADAVAFARSLGMPHQVLRTAEMANPAFTANPPERCYHCKKELFTELAGLARERGLEVVADGSNLDDLDDVRPGTRAARECGVRRPLQDGGFTKRELRSASRTLRLPTAAKPAAACLASRIPYGTPVTAEALARIEASEAALQELGFAGCRVRLHDDVARIELRPPDFGRAIRQRPAICEALSRAGSRYVTLDLRGYRTGSMNEALGR